MLVHPAVLIHWNLPACHRFQPIHLLAEYTEASPPEENAAP